MDNRELDAKVAQELFGLSIVHDFYPPGDEGQFCRRCSAEYEDTGPCARRYSSDPASCSLVLDEIERREWKWVWRCSWIGYNFVIFDKNRHGLISGKSDNRYQAVCLAALKAIEDLPALQAAEGEK